MSPLNKIPEWTSVPFLLMSILYLFWFFIVIPVETLIAPGSPFLASILYLPHFVRVLMVWYFGYKAFFGLVIGHSLAFFITTGTSPFVFDEIAIIIIGSASAVIALLILDWANFLKPAINSSKVANWRELVFLGFLASLLNAIGSSMIRLDGPSANEMLAFVLRILIGDTGSVMIGLITMMFLLRMFTEIKKNKPSSKTPNQDPE